MIRFSCGDKKVSSNFEKFQNIMTRILGKTHNTGNKINLILTWPEDELFLQGNQIIA